MQERRFSASCRATMAVPGSRLRNCLHRALKSRAGRRQQGARREDRRGDPDAPPVPRRVLDVDLHDRSRHQPRGRSRHRSVPRPRSEEAAGERDRRCGGSAWWRPRRRRARRGGPRRAPRRGHPGRYGCCARSDQHAVGLGVVQHLRHPDLRSGPRHRVGQGCRRDHAGAEVGRGRRLADGPEPNLGSSRDGGPSGPPSAFSTHTARGHTRMPLRDPVLGSSA